MYSLTIINNLLNEHANLKGLALLLLWKNTLIKMWIAVFLSAHDSRNSRAFTVECYISTVYSNSVFLLVQFTMLVNP